MSDIIFKPKKRTANATAPTVASLQDGEIAINVPAKKIFVRVGSEVLEIANASDSVAYANRLTTPRTINGTAFDGSLDITTIKWGIARNITIGNTTKAVDGSGNLAWTLAEIGVSESQGTVTRVTAGDGMNFAAVTGEGAITLGTPSTLSGSTENAVTAWSHTHALSTNLKAWDGVSPSSKYDNAAADDAGLVQWKTSSDLSVRYGTGSGVKFFRAINTTNDTPVPNSYFSVMQMTYDSTGGAQFAASVVADRAWIRRGPSANWAEIWTSSNFNPDTFSPSLSYMNDAIDGSELLSTYPNNSVLVTRRGSAAGTSWPSHGAILTAKAGSDRAGQLVFGGGGALHFRSGSGNSWTSFSEIYHTGYSGVISAQRFDVAQNYSSTSNAVALSPGTAGTIYLRPGGLGQTTKQITIDSDGNMTTGAAITSGSGVVLGNGVLARDGGPMYLRPNGSGSAVGQAQLSSGGNLSVPGTLSSSSLDVVAGNGNGIRFWGGNSNYTIYMAQADSAEGGRIGETTSDHNMYFRMSSGTNRGFVFRNGSTPIASINPTGLTSSGTISDSRGDVRKLNSRLSNAHTTLTVNDLNGIVEKGSTTAYTYTLPAGLGSRGDAITIVNAAGGQPITISPASGVSLYQNGVLGAVSVPALSMVTIYHSAHANRWLAS